MRLLWLTDIAIGTSRLFGVGLRRNFNFPYFSRDIAEFWRRWHRKSSDMARIPRNLAHLEAIAALCRKRGINLTFYTQPEYISYRNNADTFFINTMKRNISDFAQRNNARYFDLYADPRFSKEDFYDADHLNHNKGAVKLTRILADTLHI